MPYDVDIGDGADALGQNQLTDALDGTYWVSGWDSTLGTGDLEVDIAAGEGAIDGTGVSTGSTQTIDFTGDPDSTDPRKAVIYVDSGGTVQKALGTPQPVDPSGEIRFRTYNPPPPASVSGVVVAEVWLAAGETVLESADVRDRRVSNVAALPNPGPITKTDDASSFTESDTTVNTTNCSVSNGSIELTDTETQSGGFNQGSTSTTNDTGWKITADAPITSFDVTLLSSSGTSTRGLVIEDSTGDIVASTTYSSASGQFTISGFELTPGTVYRLVVDNQGNSYDALNDGSPPSFPLEGSIFDVEASFAPDGTETTTENYSIGEVTATAEFSSGSAVVSWDSPTDIFAWDIATYQRTQDGETVTVNVLDGSDVELRSDINRNENISDINTVENIKLEAQLSRQSLSNNPTLDYVARRFER